MRFHSLIVAAAAIVLARPIAAHAVDQSSDAAQLFKDFCLSDEPSFESLTAKATIMHGAKAVDHVEPLANKANIRQKAWLVMRPTGMYQITAAEGIGKSRAVGCEVTSQFGDGVDLAQTLSTEMGLGAPFKRLPAIGNRANTVVWNKNFGQHQAKIILSYGAQGATGVSLHLLLPNLPAAQP